MKHNIKRIKIDENEAITVCDNCYRACCWQGYFMCELANSSGTIDIIVKELRKIRDSRDFKEWDESEEYWLY